MIIAFDFDGTITKENNYPLCLELRKGIVECINTLYDEGHYIIIFTCRDTSNKRALTAYNIMIKYLDNHNIKYHVVNRNVTPSIDFNPIKPYWDILVDDTALGFNPEWTGSDIYNLIHSKILTNYDNRHFG